MHIDQARRIINETMGDHPPPFADWQVAGRVIAKYYDDHPELLTRVTLDGKPIPRRLTHDQIDARRRHEQHIRDNGLHVDQAPTRDAKPAARKLTRDVVEEPTVGPKRILKLDGPVTAYEVRTYGDETWLCEHSNVEGIGDPGKLGVPARVPAATGDKTLDRARGAQAQRAQGAAWADKLNERARAFWGAR